MRGAKGTDGEEPEGDGADEFGEKYCWARHLVLKMTVPADGWMKMLRSLESKSDGLLACSCFVENSEEELGSRLESCQEWSL